MRISFRFEFSVKKKLVKMFNGITSQMSSWIGKKQEDVEETVPSPKTEQPEEYIEKKEDLR